MKQTQKIVVRLSGWQVDKAVDICGREAVFLASCGEFYPDFDNY